MNDTVTFSNDTAALAHWVHEARSDHVGELDRINAILKFRNGEIDVLVKKEGADGVWFGYRLKALYAGQREQARQLTRRSYKTMLNASVA